jgi:beta-galactosidase GanA
MRALLVLLFTATTLAAQQTGPHLERRGQTTQLVVDGKPLVMLSGELHNSSSSSLDYMKPAWPQLARMGLNTVVTPLSWELVEPAEGKYDFSLVDGLLEQAREQHLRVVFLWLAAWKNGVSSYPPVWVRGNVGKYPRVMQDGRPTNTLSVLYPALREADARAFKALMEHIKSVDGQQHTVLMMQVENEVGILGSSRDHSAEADKLFAGAAPEGLLRSLAAHRETLNPELRALWEANGAKTKGTWAEVFGDTARADEIFMAWHYALYLNAVAAAGKSAYGIPMYANAWLGGGDAKPGDYPSGGPQPRVLDVWKAAGDSLDMESPDLYSADFAGWCKRYHRADNPLFIPETNPGSVGAANVFYAVGEQAALGFSPFGIDRGMHGDGPWVPPGGSADEVTKGADDLAASYHAIGDVLPEITAAQAAGTIHGFLLDKANPRVDFVVNGVIWHVSLDELFGHTASAGYGLVLEESPGHYLGVGKGFRVQFEPKDPAAARMGIGTIDEGRFEAGTWIPGRRLNGDETDQGNAWRFDERGLHTERATIYRFR